ncbi:3-dehydroquinate synthase [Paenibacillus thermoaerophilus]|uniref:3-dehydroquinate synthase n=1 Tax=Paenibacillus thermoaerophilus TaxID=1215385 RepID=A0ABW2V2U6_9BACL|nr:3-dehydroquinate synthase [Paenibacillus thermoaerophilus]TMV18704.1 3-dehydroquinate synthase [Paenibacillus thermoaerophilus]
MKTLTVDLGERSYPIHIGHGILPLLPEKLAECGIGSPTPLLVITDSAVAPHYLKPVEELLRGAGYPVTTSVIPSGEASKSLEMLDELVKVALEAGLDRKSVIIALGGGVVGDLAGFVAASYMRGIRFVQVPTTILAHDSSVGGKVAVNHKLAKNIIGAFHQPEMVFYALEMLRTLPPREVRSGLAEVAKHGLIWDAAFVEWCESNADKLLALDPEALEYALYTGCSVKAQVVGQDERENGLRAILNLGHTIGHALEAVSRYELLHGEAISIGMVGSAKLAVRFGRDPVIYETTKRLLRKLELPVAVPSHIDTSEVMRTMMYDKKFKDGRTVFVLPEAIGRVEIVRDVPVAWVEEVVEELKREA